MFQYSFTLLFTFLRSMGLFVAMTYWRQQKWEKASRENHKAEQAGQDQWRSCGQNIWFLKFFIIPVTHGIAESPVWKTIDCASWLLGGWRWRAGKWHLQRRCQDPESWARAAAPPSSIQHQTELTSQPGAPQPLCRSYGDRGVTQTLFFWLFFPVLLFHTFIYMSPDFAIDLYCGLVYLVSACHSCHVGGLAPLQIATSHYTHPDKLQTSDVLHPSKIPKPWWVSSIRNCFSHTMSVI